MQQQVALSSVTAFTLSSGLGLSPVGNTALEHASSNDTVSFMVTNAKVLV